MKQRRLFSLRPPASSHLFTLNSSLYSLFIVLHNRYQLFQKALLAQGVELAKNTAWLPPEVMADRNRSRSRSLYQQSTFMLTRLPPMPSCNARTRAPRSGPCRFASQSAPILVRSGHAAVQHCRPLQAAQHARQSLPSDCFSYFATVCHYPLQYYEAGSSAWSSASSRARRSARAARPPPWTPSGHRTDQLLRRRGTCRSAVSSTIC